MRADLKALADIVIQSVRAKIAPLMKRMDDLDEVVKALPDAVSKDLDSRITKAVDAIPRPKDGEPGLSVTVEDVSPLIAEEVTKAVAAMPPPKDGANGTSVTAEDVAPMISAEVEKAVSAIPAPKDGESVPIESVQLMIDEAVRKAMESIRQPVDGQPGRDALQIELQPEIDLGRSYPRGTYAKHAGGMWRAFEATKGLHGWECVVEGMAALEIEQNGREFKVVARRSSGAEVSKSIKVASLIDRGVFKAGNEYEAGDGVTWGGSYFIAQKDAPLGHPGEPGCDGWRLAVKRGRDGTSGVKLNG